METIPKQLTPTFHLYRYMPIDLQWKFFIDIAKCCEKSLDHRFFGNILVCEKQVTSQQPNRQNNVQNH